MGECGGGREGVWRRVRNIDCKREGGIERGMEERIRARTITVLPVGGR